VVESREHVERAQTLVERLGARRFEAENLTYLAQMEHVEGRTGKALAHLNQALAIARQSGMGYFGPTSLGTLALITPDADVRHRALEEAEAVLRAGAVSHNYLWFYRDAMEASLACREWAEAERYAAALEAYTRTEPLPWSDFYIARARALAAYGRGVHDRTTMDTLSRLREEAERGGLRAAVAAIEAALAPSEPRWRIRHARGHRRWAAAARWDGRGRSASCARRSAPAQLHSRKLRSFDQPAFR